MICDLADERLGHGCGSGHRPTQRVVARVQKLSALVRLDVARGDVTRRDCEGEEWWEVFCWLNIAGMVRLEDG